MEPIRPIKMVFVCGLILLLGFAVIHVGAGPQVIPQMAECMQAHGSVAKYMQVVSRYCDSDMLKYAPAIAVIERPQVIEAYRSGRAICYWVEGFSYARQPFDSVAREYSVCWENARIVALGVTRLVRSPL
jgi:hypothetical protein